MIRLSRHLEMTSKNENSWKSPKDPPTAPITSSILLTLFFTSSKFARIWHVFKYSGSFNSSWLSFLSTLRSQIEGYTRLLIFRKISTLCAVIWAYPFINFKKISSVPVFSPTQVEKIPPYPLLLKPNCLSNLKKNSSLPFY